MQINPGEKVSKSGDTMTGRLNIDDPAGNSGLWLGNSIVQGNTGASRGLILLYGLNQYYGQMFDAYGLTANRNYFLPDATGTIALKEDLLTDTFTSVGAGTTSQAIYQLHGSLSDNQKCSCLMKYGSTELFVTGYRANSARGRYLALGRTGDDVLAFRVYGNIVTQNVISGTITTETIS